MKRRAGLPRLALVAVATVLAVVSPAAPAGAHGAQGTLGIEVTPGAAPLTAKVRVLLEYANDREVAPGATVTASAAAPGGQTVGAQPLADEGKGAYETTLTMPAAGQWTVTVTASDPTATAQAPVVVSATASTPTSVASGSGGTLTGDLGDVRTSSDEANRESTSGNDGDDDRGDSRAAWIVVIGVVLVGAAVGAVLVVRRRPRG